MGRSASAGTGAAAAGAAACTLLRAHPPTPIEIPQASRARSIRVSVVRLGIYRFSAAIGRPISLAFPAGASTNRASGSFSAERRAASRLRFEFYPAIVQLHKSKRVCQPDAAASGPGREEKLENFLLVPRRNSPAGVLHGNHRELAVAPQAKRDSASGVGELAGVNQEVQNCLMNQLAVDQDRRTIGSANRRAIPGWL